LRLVQSLKGVATDPLERLDLMELIRDTVSVFSINARKAGIKVMVHSEVEDPTWVGYRGYLGQVLLNLLTNVDATPIRTGLVVVWTPR
jgi:signal transduction histidine kinase